MGEWIMTALALLGLSHSATAPLNQLYFYLKPNANGRADACARRWVRWIGHDGRKALSAG